MPEADAAAEEAAKASEEVVVASRAVSWATPSDRKSSMAGQWMLRMGFGVLLIVTHFLYVIAAHKDTKSRAGLSCFLLQFISLLYPPRSHDAMAKKNVFTSKVRVTVVEKWWVFYCKIGEIKNACVMLRWAGAT